MINVPKGRRCKRQKAYVFSVSEVRKGNYEEYAIASVRIYCEDGTHEVAKLCSNTIKNVESDSIICFTGVYDKDVPYKDAKVGNTLVKQFNRIKLIY